MKTQTSPLPVHDDILRVLPRLPGPDLAAATAAMAAADGNKTLRGFLARWQGRQAPRAGHPCLAVFAANHGVAALWQARQSAAEKTAAILQDGGALKRLAAEADCDLRLYDMNLAQPVRNIFDGPAMTRDEALHAVAYGMTAVPMGLDILALASCGDGQELAAAIMIAALLNQPTARIVGLCGAPSDFAPQIEDAVRRAALQAPLDMLESYGGREIAAIFGAMIAARMAHTPVAVTGAAGLAAAALLHCLDHRATQHIALAGGIEGWGLLPELQRCGVDEDGETGAAAARAILAFQAAC